MWKNQALSSKTAPSLWVTGVGVEQSFFCSIQSCELSLNTEGARWKTWNLQQLSTAISSSDGRRSGLGNNTERCIPCIASQNTFP